MKNSDLTYEFIINNCKNYLRGLGFDDKLDFDSINAFRMSEILSIALCKDKEKIILDLCIDF